MILQCPRCNAKFKVPDNAVPPMGREVRCSKCAFNWHARRPDAVSTGIDMLADEDHDPEENPEDAAARLLSDQPAPPRPKKPKPAAATPSSNPDDDDYTGFPIESDDDEKAFKKDQGGSGIDLVFEDAQSKPDAPTEANPKEAEFDAAFAKNLEKIFEQGAPEKKPAKGDRPKEEGEQTARKTKTPTKPIGLYVAIGAGLLLVAFVASLYGFRTALQPAMPGLYDLLGMPRTDGLVLMDLQLHKKPSKNKAKFVVEGRIVNQAMEPRKVPMVRVGIVSKDGEMLMLREYEVNATLKPEEAYPFTASKLETNFVDKVDHLVIDIGNGTELMLRE